MSDGNDLDVVQALTKDNKKQEPVEKLARCHWDSGCLRVLR
jgi:hypothetical protein